MPFAFRMWSIYLQVFITTWSKKTHNDQTNSKNYVESLLNADFKFRDRYTNREFYVEAKLRSYNV